MAAFVLPASAAVLDYNDYVTNVSVDGDNDIVTVSLPVDGCIFLLYASSGEHLGSFGNNLLSYDFDSAIDYIIDFDPVYPNYIDLSNIPDGTLFFLELNSDASDLGVYDWGRLTVSGNFYYYDPYRASDLRFLDSAPSFGNTSWSFELDKQGAEYGSFGFRFSPVSLLESGTKSFSVESFTLQMSISSLYRLQVETGKTNTILKEVEKQLADQGKTLDDVLGAQQETNNKLDEIINGTVDPSAPAGSGNVGDLDDAESGLRDDAQTGLDQGIAMQQSALSVFLQYSAAFAVAGDIFGVFADIPFFSFLLYVSVAIGLFALLLNLGLNGISAYERKQHRSKKGG